MKPIEFINFLMEEIVLDPNSVNLDLTTSKHSKVRHNSITKEPGQSDFTLNLKPEHSKKSVFRALKADFKRIKSLPIEYFENELYSLCYKYQQQFNGESINLDIIPKFHHIWRLKKKEHLLPTEHSKFLAQCIQTEVNENPNIYNEYKLLLDCLDLLSSLVIKWRISNIYNIIHRFQHVVTIIQVIDVGEFNSNYFSMETIALSFYVLESPLKKIASTECKDYAKVLQQAFWNLLVNMLALNDRKKLVLPSIAEILACKSEYVAEALGAKPNSDYIQVYQSLEKPSFFSRLFHKDKYSKVLKFRGKLVEFDMAYRMFEVSIFNCFIGINHHKYN